MLRKIYLNFFRQGKADLPMSCSIDPATAQNTIFFKADDCLPRGNPVARCIEVYAQPIFGQRLHSCRDTVAIVADLYFAAEGTLRHIDQPIHCRGGKGIAS